MPGKPEYSVTFQLFPLGDAAVVVQFGDTISKETFASVQALAVTLEKQPFPGMIEYVPAFTTVTVFYNPWVLSEKGKYNPYEKAVYFIKDRINSAEKKLLQAPPVIDIPVCYGGEFGPDLPFVAAHNHLTPQEVIRIHSSVEYLVYMIGFAPGFPYLGGMNEKIAAPRKQTPRKITPAGSVGIAGTQTGVYPIETPGGWQLIGRTPLPLFDPQKFNPTLLKAGDLVRLVPIPEAEYLKRKNQQHGINILKPGLLTTIQDNGRYGYKKYGVIVSGSMDAAAHRIANWLVGNEEQEAVIEITLIGPEICFLHDCLLAVTGADMSPRIDNYPVQCWRPVLVRKGSLLTFGTLVNGCRTYIAFAGGLAIPKIMGSKSTYLRAQTGGWHGRALQAGDRIPLNPPGCSSIMIKEALIKHHNHHAFAAATWTPAPQVLPDYNANLPVRAIKGPEYELFSAESRQRFWSSPFRVSSQSDRMGYWLQGPSLTLMQPVEVLSSAVTFGTVQVPAAGNPIVLMADHQTTGGYPRIAQVITADLPKLAQVSPGNLIRFQEASLEEAQQLYFQQERNMEQIKKALQLKLLEIGSRNP